MERKKGSVCACLVHAAIIIPFVVPFSSVCPQSDPAHLRVGLFFDHQEQVPDE